MHKTCITMFYAVYESGRVDMRLEFNMLHKSGDILFFAEDLDYKQTRYYYFIDKSRLRVQLSLKGCKINQIILHLEGSLSHVELEIESPNHGVEVVEVYKEHPLSMPHLSYLATIFGYINRVGYEAYRKYDLKLE